MVNQTKIYEVENIQAILNGAKSVALVDYQGLTAEQIRKLRNDVKQASGLVYVTKNSLIAIALKNIGIDLPGELTGPTALVVANEDEVAPLKEVDNARKQFERPEFKYGVYQGKLLSLEELTEFINLPDKEVLLARFVAGLANPLQRLIYAMKYNQTKLALVLKAIADKN